MTASSPGTSTDGARVIVTGRNDSTTTLADDNPKPPQAHKTTTARLDPAALIILPNPGERGMTKLAAAISTPSMWKFEPHEGGAVAYDKPEGSKIAKMVTSDGFTEAQARQLIDALGPRTLRTLIGVTTLLLDRNPADYDRKLKLTPREIAIAAGWMPDRWRHIEPETLRGIDNDLQALSRCRVRAASGPFDSKTRRWRDVTWISTLIDLGSGVMQPTLDGDALPVVYEISLGTAWRYALEARMLLAPGFRQLNAKTDPIALKLAIFYAVEFRVAMKRDGQPKPFSVPQIAAVLGYHTKPTNWLTRILDRIEEAHAQLVACGIIGSAVRTPSLDGSPKPSRVWGDGFYTIEPCEEVAAAYRKANAEAHARRRNGKNAQGRPS